MEFAKRRVSTSVFVVAFALWTSWANPGHAQTEVSFPTEDGWTIYGTLYLPTAGSPAPVPGVVLLTEPEWVDRSIYDTYLARKLAKGGMAALSIDLRGTGSSLGKKEFEAFSQQEADAIRLDVRGAIQFLSSQKAVDPQRIGVVGAGISADYAVLEASGNRSVGALVLISGSLSPKARDSIQSQSNIPILAVAGKKDKGSFREMAQAYSLSPNESSDLILAVGHGTVMFSHTAGLEEQVIQWLEKNLRNLGTETAVSFPSEDGWPLQGFLRLPDGVAKEKVPGVVLVHGAKHDQQTYYHLARELAKNGIASLRFDWRGKGRSIQKGKPIYGVNLPEADLGDMAFRDVKAAVEFLAARQGVYPERIGMVAATLGCSFALQAAVGDSRIKTIVLLTALEQTPEVQKFLGATDIPILAVASAEDNNYQRGSLAETTRTIYQLSKSKWSEFLLYDDAGRGSEMFKAKPELQGMVLRWLGEKLGNGGPGRESELRRGK